MAKTRTSTTKRTVAPKEAKAKSKSTARKNAANKHAAKIQTRRKAADASHKKPPAKKPARNEPGKNRPAGERLVTVDRRKDSDRRAEDDRRKKPEPVAVERRSLERRAKVSRRRQIDPTTCERDYSDDELEFMNALDAYKRTSGRMFPTCSEILEVVRGLGYQKPSDDEQPGDDASIPAQNQTGVNNRTDLFPAAALTTADADTVAATTETLSR